MHEPRSNTLFRCLLIILLLLPRLVLYAGEAGDNCHPPINSKQANYLVGYGSLMNEESRSRTNPEVKQLTPVRVKGFIRDWNTITPGYQIIYLGALPCNTDQKNCFLNGLAYLVPDVKAADEREGPYCRQEISHENLQPYKREDSIDPKARYWIYVTKKEDIYHPDQKHPLIQSYVDLFIGGCIEQAANIAHKKVNDLSFPDDYGFVFDCISGTIGWTTTHWLNDRVYPERPWAASPYALKIDKILAKSNEDGLISGEYPYLDIPLQ